MSQTILPLKLQFPISCVSCKRDLLNSDNLFVCPGCHEPYHRSCWKRNKSSTQNAVMCCQKCQHIFQIQDSHSYPNRDAAILRGVLSLSSVLALVASVILPARAFMYTDTYAYLSYQYSYLPEPLYRQIEMEETYSDDNADSLSELNTEIDNFVDTPEDVVLPTPTATPSASSDELTSEVTETLRRWSSIKSDAYVHERSYHLHEVLTEPALSIRMEGVAYWQRDSSRYYQNLEVNEMQINEIRQTGSNSAEALVFVRESHQTSLGDKDVSGNFLYLFKKQGDRWYISDIRQIN